MDNKKTMFDDINADATSQASQPPPKTGEYIPKDDKPNGEQAGPPPNNRPDVSTAQILKTIYESIFNSMLQAWEVTPDEIQIMADMQGGALDAWFPEGVTWLNNDVIEKIILTGGAVMVTAQVFGPRMKAAKEKKKEKAKQSDATATPSEQPATKEGGDYEW